MRVVQNGLEQGADCAVMFYFINTHTHGLLFRTWHISVDRRWRLHLVSSLGRKTRRRPVGVVPRRKQGIKGRGRDGGGDGREDDNKYGGGDGREDEYRGEHERKDRGEKGSEDGIENGDENIDGGGE